MIATGRPTAPGQPSRALTLALGVAVACLLATAAIVWSPRLLFGIHAPELHLILDSVDASIAALVAFLLWGRFRREHHWRPLLLALGLLLLVLAAVLGGVLHATAGAALSVWWPQAVRVEAAALVALGALAGRRHAPRRSAGTVVVGAVALVILMGLGLGALGSALPVPVSASPASAAAPVVTGHPMLLLAHALGGLAFLVAAAVFTREALGRSDDVLVTWLAPACVLGAFSRVHYVLFPSIYSGWLYTGDVLRTLCYLLLLVGAAAEIARYWDAQSELAVRADRRRVARELHDGVVQELGYIASQTAAEPLSHVREAALRGLDEARGAVEALDRGDDESFDLQLHRLARQLTERYGVRVVLDVDVSVPVDTDHLHPLLRIVREAAGNAARHGGAAAVGIGLTRDSTGRRLVVHDDGTGFDLERVPGRGYGLTSMKDRAMGLGGVLDLRSTPGRGTTVTVTW